MADATPLIRTCIKQNLESVRMLTGAPGTIRSLEVKIRRAADGVWYESVFDLQAYSPPESPFDPNINDCCGQLVAFRVGRAITTIKTFNTVAGYPDTKQLALTSVTRLKANLKE